MGNKSKSSVLSPLASPFAALAALELPRGRLPEPSEEVGPKEARGPARAVVRLERKHRRGKEVTVIEKLGLHADELEQWCRDLKRTLGCGGGVEQASIVLQGDFRSRLAEVLTKMGVRRITVSG